MTLNIPDSAKELEARSKSDVQRELTGSNPFLKNSWLGALVTSAANRIFDFYLQLKAAMRENFPDTATGDYLIRWAAIWGKEKQAATKSSGRIVATGTAGATIPIGTLFTVADIGEFVSTSAATIATDSIAIDDLTRDGSTATAKTASDHGLANGVDVTVAGAANSDYNITAEITVTDLDEFQYEIIGSPPDEIGTAATASFTIAGVEIESQEFGQAVNADAGTPFKLQSPIIGVDDILIADFGAIGGGTDEETDESLRARLLDRIQNPVAHFNVASITEKAKEVPGVTRVFVQEITPAIGQVTIYFMRDNDLNPIPSASEVEDVKEAILEIKPANTQDDDVIVLAPTPVTVAFIFTDIQPNTSTMKEAVSANLRQFFDATPSVGEDIDEDAYRSAIFNTIDTVTGDHLSTFTISTPIGDIAIADGEIGILGDITYP